MKKTKIGAVLFSLFLASCASTPSPEKKQFEKELAGLNAELKIQREEITHLQNQLLKFEAEKKRVAAKGLGASLLRKKLVVKKKPEIVKPKPQVLLPMEVEGTTIADSSHEDLHKYFKAIQLIRDRKQDEGLILLREFISENPDHVYADRAELIIADQHLKNEQYGLVIQTTGELERRYPRSVKLPEALYKRGNAFLGLHQKKQAIKVFERILKEFPEDKVAALAGKRLASLETPHRSESP